MTVCVQGALILWCEKQSHAKYLDVWRSVSGYRGPVVHRIIVSAQKMQEYPYDND